MQNRTPLADGIDRLDPLLSSLSGKTAVFIFTDGTFQRIEPKKLWPMDAIKKVAEKHPDTCFYFISSAKPGKPQKLLNDMAGVNVCSRVIPFDEVYKNPVYGGGILYLVDSTKEVVTTSETRFVGVEVGNIHFDFDKSDILPQYATSSTSWENSCRTLRKQRWPWPASPTMSAMKNTTFICLRDVPKVRPII